MEKLFTIGFTKKSAEYFFELLKCNQVDVVLDVRLNNTSQLAGFSKYPDIKYFLREICNIQYISDIEFAPEEWVLKDYKTKKITWEEYVFHFDKIMEQRGILERIRVKYSDFAEQRICLLCSEEKAANCHRSLVAQRFREVFDSNIINL